MHPWINSCYISPLRKTSLKNTVFTRQSFWIVRQQFLSFRHNFLECSRLYKRLCVEYFGRKFCLARFTYIKPHRFRRLVCLMVFNTCMYHLESNANTGNDSWIDLMRDFKVSKFEVQLGILMTRISSREVQKWEVRTIPYKVWLCKNIPEIVWYFRENQDFPRKSIFRSAQWPISLL